MVFVLKAITLCPNVPIYWTNRARCHLKRKYARVLNLFFFLNKCFFFMLIDIYFLCSSPSFRSDWTKVEADCRKAIQLDNNSVKVCFCVPFIYCNCCNVLFSCLFIFLVKNHRIARWGIFSSQTYTKYWAYGIQFCVGASVYTFSLFVAFIFFFVNEYALLSWFTVFPFSSLPSWLDIYIFFSTRKHYGLGFLTSWWLWDSLIWNQDVWAFRLFETLLLFQSLKHATCAAWNLHLFLSYITCWS